MEPRRYAAVVKDAQSVSLQVSIVTSAVQVHLLLYSGHVGFITILLLVVGLICIGQVLVRNVTGVTQPVLEAVHGLDALGRYMHLAVCGIFRVIIAHAGRQLEGGLLRAFRQIALLIAGVYFLSPLYSTLARAISGDTITAAATWLFLAHLYMHDYFFHVSVADKLSGSLSMAAAVAGSLLLASRLGSPTKVVRTKI